MRILFKKYIFLLDPLFALLAIFGFSGLVARRFMSFSERSLPLTRYVFSKFHYLPIREHYYEPLTFSAEGFKYRERIASILFDGQRNFDWLSKAANPEEFMYALNEGVLNNVGFKSQNGTFEAGDAEALFYAVRYFKPRKIIEVGAGNSSKVIQAALKLNELDGKAGHHIVIEPYENPWLEQLDATVIRQRVEEVNFELFESLEQNDLLFIDSSHVIRAQNDCVFEYTEILPCLKLGVVVHIHDIFTPFDYPDEWLNKIFHLWGEQYVLEALIANSNSWKIIAPLCWLSRDPVTFQSYCPTFTANQLPGSFWIQKSQ